METNAIRAPIHITVDGPWDSKEDTEAFKKASDLYEEYKGKEKYVALVRSHHEYSQGYWIEFERKKTSFPDLLLKCTANEL